MVTEEEIAAYPTCTSCGGTGEQDCECVNNPSDDPDEVCEECEGEGWVDCENCHGLGYTEAAKA